METFLLNDGTKIPGYRLWYVPDSGRQHLYGC